MLPFGAGNLKVEKVLACDVSFDTMDDVDEKTRNDRRWAKHGDYSIQGMIEAVGKEFGDIDILIHSVAFSPEIKNKAIDTSRKALPDRAEHQRLFADRAVASGPAVHGKSARTAHRRWA